MCTSNKNCLRMDVVINCQLATLPISFVHISALDPFSVLKSSLEKKNSFKSNHKNQTPSFFGH